MRNIIRSANMTHLLISTWANPEHPVGMKPDGINSQLGLKKDTKAVFMEKKKNFLRAKWRPINCSTCPFVYISNYLNNAMNSTLVKELKSRIKETSN